MFDFLNGLFSEFSRSEFWENGTVMIVVCLIISALFTAVLCIATKGFKTSGRLLWAPAVVCVPIMLFGFIMLFFPNGTGGVTQHFYLGILMYALCVLVFTGIGESLIIFLGRK